ncbi:hypothetical protein [Gemmatimonas sp.]
MTFSLRRCEICDATLSLPRVAPLAGQPDACDRAECRLAAAFPSPDFRCRYCHRLKALFRRGQVHCGRSTCERRYFESVLREDAQRRADHLERLKAERAQVLRKRGLPQIEPARIATGLVPFVENVTRPLGAKRRRLFEAHLRRMLDAAREPVAPFESIPSSEPEGPQYERYAALSGSARELLGAACAACRGWCCSQWGGNRAFIKPDTMRKARERQPEASDDDIVAEYLSHLPSRSAVPGCVYQGARGCTLPRELRGSECNRYLCDGLRVLADRIADGGDAGVYVGHEEARWAHRRALRVLPVLVTPHE